MTKHPNHAQDPAPARRPGSGEGLRRALPEQALQWLGAGAALGALRTGARVAGGFVRRNPLLVGAAVAAGVGLLWYAARQRARQQAALKQQTRQVRAWRRGDYEQDDYGV